MIENLRTQNYSNSEQIPQVTDNLEWSQQDTGAWCWYENNQTYEEPYGKLYNWYAINSGVLCPGGWHVVTDGEYNDLATYLVTNAGGKMKEKEFAHWNSPNNSATNESGFSGLPAGSRESGAREIASASWWRQTPSGALTGRG